MKPFLSILCHFTALCLVQKLFGEASPGSKPPVGIPFDRIGAAADVQYRGQGLAVSSTPAGAQIECVFQRLNGRATTQGLWLASTVNGSKGEPFRVIARSLGRADGRLLGLSGSVEVNGQIARFVRPELIEEYKTGFLYKPREGVSTLAEQIVALRRDSARFGELSDKCRKIAEDEFSLPLFGRRLENLYSEIMKR